MVRVFRGPACVAQRMTWEWSLKKVGMEQGWVWQLPKMLRNAEDAHIIKVSTFGSDEHLQSEFDRSLADGPTRPRLNTEAWR